MTPTVITGASNEVVTLGDHFPILSPQNNKEIQQLILENSGARGLAEADFERIVVPSGGHLQFVVQTIEGEESSKDLTGIVVGWRDIRLRYSKPFGQGGKTPPDCSSKDGFWGVGDPGGDCGQCPFAEWGSDTKGGRGQACKQVRQLLFLREGQILPNLVNIPPTSLKSASNFFLRLSSSRLSYWALLTRITLERATNAEGVAYARMVFTAGPRLNETERASLKPFAEQMQAMLKPLVVETEDYEVQGTATEQTA